MVEHSTPRCERAWQNMRERAIAEHFNDLDERAAVEQHQEAQRQAPRTTLGDIIGKQLRAVFEGTASSEA